MESYTKDNGMAPKDKAMEDKYGEMVQFMRGCGLITWLMVKVDSSIQVEMCMRVNG